MRALAFAVLACALALGQDLTSIQPQGYVSDFAHVLPAEIRQQAEVYCTRIEQATGAQIAIVLIPSLNGAPVEDAANSLFRRWGIGKKGKDEGLLLLLATQDRKDRL